MLYGIFFWMRSNSRSDAPCSKHTIAVATEEIVNKIYGILLADCRVKVKEIVGMVKISNEHIANILHENFQFYGCSVCTL